MSKVTRLHEKLFCEAIRRRHLLEFSYRGLLRIVAPYCHGISTRGLESLRGVQLRGSSQSNSFGIGKLWTVAEMGDVRLLDETFVANDPTYNPNDSGMRHIHCRL